MRTITGYYADCPTCGREVAVILSGGGNIVPPHTPKGQRVGVDDPTQCAGSASLVPDESVTVVRLG